MIATADLARRIALDGWAPLGQFEGESACRDVIEFIDRFPVDRSEVNYGGSEKRIWKAHENCEGIARFRRYADEAIAALFEKHVVSRDVLAIRNRPVDEDDALREGRWHLDSLRRQIKIFLFLTEVTDQNGPLELVPGSHRSVFKALHALEGQLVRPTDFVGQTRRYQRLDDSWTARMADAAGGTHAFTCPAGSAFVVNTSAIHRARPCIAGERYALTAYYDHF